MSAYVCLHLQNQLIICMDFGDIQHDLLYVKNLNIMLRKPTDVGMSNLFLIANMLNSLLKGVYQLNIKYK